MKKSIFAVGCFLSVLAGSSYATMTGIDIISETNHVWGKIYFDYISLNESYDITDSTTVSGNKAFSGTVSGLKCIYNSMASAGNGILDAGGYASIQAVDSYQSDWGTAPSDAQSDYLFKPQTTWLEISFTGRSGTHAFESWCSFELRDLTDSAVVDSRLWKYEFGRGWMGDILPYTGLYSVSPDHLYSMQIRAHAKIGDNREGFAHLEMTVTPEPATIALLALGGVIVRKFKRKN